MGSTWVQNKLNLTEHMYQNEPIKIDAVSIDVHGGSYRLRFRYQGKRYSLATAKVGKDGYKVAVAKAQEINSDITFERLDTTLAKYSQRVASKIANINQTPSLNLKEVWEQYKLANVHRVELTSQKHCWKLVDRALAKLPPTALLPENANSLVQTLLQHYAIGTIERVLNDLVAASNYAFKNSQIPGNFWGNVKSQLPDTPKSKRSNEAFSQGDLNAILDAFKNNTYVKSRSAYGDNYYTHYVQFLMLTGCRPEEAIALTWNDLKLERDKPMIMITKAYSKGILKGTKGKESRMFPVNDELREFLLSVPKRHELLVFPSVEGVYIDQNNFNNRIWSCVVKALVADGKVERYLPTYHLRHTYINYLLDNNVPIQKVAALVGNSVAMINSHYCEKRTDGIVLPNMF